MPDEAVEHADAVVLGEAEPLWPRVIEDLRGGRLDRIYRGAPPARFTTCGNRPSRDFACWIPRTTTASQSKRRVVVHTVASSVPGRVCTAPATARRRSTKCSARSGHSARSGTGRFWSSPTIIFSSIAVGAASCSSGSAPGGPLVRRDGHLHRRRPGPPTSPAPGRLLPASHRAGEPLARKPRGDRIQRMEGRPPRPLRPLRAHDPGCRSDGQHVFHRRAGSRHAGRLRRHPPFRPPGQAAGYPGDRVDAVSRHAALRTIAARRPPR